MKQAPGALKTSDIVEEAGVPADVYERMVALRRDLHRQPELSGQEQRTAERIVAELDRLGVESITGVGGHGIVARIPGERADPCVALRADTDALPIHEETGLPFASECAGVMHACGHDGHSAMLLGATELLLAGPTPPVDVRLLWQPSEEHGTGAAAMIADGALKSVGMIFGGHVDRHYPPGVIVASEGAVNASSDAFTVEFCGRQGHGARPHEALDAIVVGSLFVTALQTIVSREIDPANPSVVSVGRFDAGTAPNVIAGRACLQGTIRAQTKAVRDHLNEAVKRIAEAVGQLHGAEVSVTLGAGGTPPVVNTRHMAKIARTAARDVLGDGAVPKLRTANMGGEDFGWYLQEVPGAYVRIGSQVSGRESEPAHSSRFDMHEAALATGAAWFARVAHVAGAELAATAAENRVT